MKVKRITDFLKNKAIDTIDYTLCLLNKLRNKVLNQNKCNEYEMLLPNEDSDQDNHYSNALAEALNNPLVHNVAITGPYGSGKSSFLKSFIKKYCKWNYLNISLATFSDNETDISDSEQNAGTISGQKKSIARNQDIERSILQQIFYTENTSNIPFSRFKRINHIKNWRIFMHTALLSVVFIYALFKLFPKIFSIIVPYPLEFLSQLILKFSGSISISVILIFFFYLYVLIKYLIRFQVTKLDLRQGQIELNKGNEDRSSIFNDKLEEIVYFFEVSEYDTIIIEDLDRFNDTNIFIKLRELNGLLNSSKTIKRNIRFIYAIKDEIFIDKDRTKFFDFILPIIPYINPSNSYEKLKLKLNGEKELNQDFLNDIALYIDDMRLLINISNEFKLYKNKLCSDKLDINKLLAVITYKNFAPAEFAKLHYGTSLINKVLIEKRTYIHSIIKDIQTKIQGFQKEINDINEENIHSIQELRMIYIFKLAERFNTLTFFVDKMQFNMTQLLEDGNYDRLLISNNINSHNRNYPPEVNFADIEKLCDGNQSYKNREKLVTSKNDGKLKKLKQEIESFHKEIDSVKSFKLSEIMQKYQIDAIDNLLIGNDLLKYMLKEGCIDEDYQYYISFFHEGSISITDREFLLSIKNSKNHCDFTCQLNNIDGVLKRLNKRDFDSAEVLNYDLFNYICVNQIAPELSYLEEILKKETENTISFHYWYLDNASNSALKAFLPIAWKKLFWNAIEDKNDNDKLMQYFKHIISLDVVNIEKFNFENCLVDYLKSYNVSLELTDEENAKVILLIKKFNIVFDKLPEIINEELFNYIYENSLYTLNKENVLSVLNYYDSANAAIVTANYTTIMNSELNKLKAYISENLNEYIENVFLEIDENRGESVSNIVDLINNSNISLDNKIKIIEKEIFVVKDVSDVSFEQKVWDTLFSLELIMCSWDNIAHYYVNNDEITDVLVKYMNLKSVYLELQKTQCKNIELFGEDTIKAISRKLIFNNSFTDEAYPYIVDGVYYSYTSSNGLSKLSQVKINSLLDKKKLTLTQDNIESLRNNVVEGLVVKLIDDYQESFIENFSNYVLTVKELSDILSSPVSRKDFKLKLIELIPKEQIIASPDLIDAVANLLKDNDAPVDDSIFETIFYKTKYPINLRFLIKQIQLLDQEKLINLLKHMSGKYAELHLRSSERLVLPGNRDNKELLLNLQNRGIISSFKETSFGEYKVNRKRK